MTSRLSSSPSGHKRTYNFLNKRQTDCTTATLYKAPLAGAVVSSAEPLTVAWDTACFATNPQTVDLRLYAPNVGGDSARLQIWKEVPYAPGSYQVKLFPRWWNDTETVELRFLVQESGNPFSGYYGLGPKFTATYTPRADGKLDAEADMSIIDTGYTWVKNFIKGLSGGQIAAAVICPILFICIVVGTIFYVRRSRNNVQKKRERFSTMVDKRMSTISTNWQSMSAAGAQAAIRNSMATFGRPSADLATLGHESTSGNTVGSGPRPQTRARSGTRVSFAPESMYGRPSNAGESVRTSISAGPTRSYHFGDAPPVPARKGSSDENLTLSPTQHAGAFSLSAYEIDNRASQYKDSDVQPALQMMREANGATEPMFVAHDAPLPPVPAATATPKSPLGMMPMMSSALSPDAGLREYAARKQAMSPATQTSFPMPMSPTLPSPAASRTLYSPQGQAQASNPFRKSLAPTEDSVYDGVEEDVPRRF
ncbi:hypothetical protein AURDEDRAFT_115749 [Auricularia subglabra TFB-10046 SS5]|uniref:Uncharacterized protein n=1 Tax=Auricularia subglabra (strain TFB-10046 / SS5) TaxID=717982 RepID=J0LJT5_AURST|nr:hypothetical protein AURDEDRAFT_115749 [Auricularia subglabra TFB-10046 SS5]